MHDFADLIAPDRNVEPGRDWEAWLGRAFGLRGFAPHQRRFWRWAWGCERGKRPRPFVGVWSRDHGKSTSAEASVVALGARKVASFALYVCGTQKQANERVQEIEALLGSPYIQRNNTPLSDPQLTYRGRQKSWRRGRLITRGGLTVEALGLDAAIRGAKIEQVRPDYFIFDDIDTESDTPEATEKKIKQITQKILPAKGPHVKVLCIQNLILPNGVFARLVDQGPDGADFLVDRIVCGPVPAVEGLATERRFDEDLGHHRDVIVAGRATWPERKPLAACQEDIDTEGLTAFLRECQHEVEDIGGGIFDGHPFRRCRWEDVPDLVRCVVYVDPAVSEKDSSDSMGVQADGLAPDGTVYRLYSWEQVSSPAKAMQLAILKAIELGATDVGVETNQGGDLWRKEYNRAWEALCENGQHPQITKRTRKPRYRDEKATKSDGSKKERGMRMLADYERDRVVHVRGTHLVLERALNRAFVHKPYDLADAAYYAWNDLRNSGTGKVHRVR